MISNCENKFEIGKRRRKKKKREREREVPTSSMARNSLLSMVPFPVSKEASEDFS
jgi:hypothetical protein